MGRKMFGKPFLALAVARLNVEEVHIAPWS